MELTPAIADSAGAAAQRAWEILGGRLGIVKRCRTIAADAGFARLHFVHTDPTRTSVVSHSDVSGATGGCGVTLDEALLTAIGEAVERYCCACYEPRDLVRASQRDLGDGAIGMDVFALYSEGQRGHPSFPFSTYRPDVPICWVRGRSLMGDGERFVPASLVYVPYLPCDEHDFLTYAVSTGQACHTDPLRALLTGLYEVIERDAYMITWLRGMRVPRVDIHGDAEIMRFFEQHFAGGGVELHVFDVTSDMKVPTFLCFAEGEVDGRTIYGTGASTRVSVREAIRKAMVESVHTYLYAIANYRGTLDWHPAPDYSNLFDFKDHVRLYAEPDARDKLAFLLDTPRRRAVADIDDHPDATPEQTLAHCLAQVRAAGLEALVVDITTPELAAAGYCVPKVFIPGVVPLTVKMPAVGSPRLRSVPIALGYGEEVRDQWNRVPHSFP